MILINTIRMSEECKKRKRKTEKKMALLRNFLFSKCPKTSSLALILLTIVLSGCTDKMDESANNTHVNQTPITTGTPIPFLSEPTTVYVEIFGSAFTPSELHVIKGTTVQWINKDSSQHAIYINNISSPTLNKRDKWNYTFNQSGKFEYNCTIQKWMQHGQVIVR